MAKLLVFCFTLATYCILGGCAITCGSNTNSKFGILTSPNYPNNYGNNHECITVITVPRGYHMQISVLDVDIETHSSCAYDYLEIIDGSASSDSVLGKYCGKREQFELTSESNDVRIKLKTDGSVVKAGFRLAWKINGSVTCGSDTNDKSGILISPNYPANYINTHVCTSVITVAPGKHIEITINDVDIEDHSECTYDYLELFEGGTTSGYVLGKYCGEKTSIKLSSRTNEVTVKFKTDSSVVKAGFRLSWRTSDAITCGSNSYLEFGILVSPYYPKDYINAHLCVSMITVPAGKSIEITIEDMDLEGHDTCVYDYLEVRNGRLSSGNLLGRYCDRREKIRLRTTSNSVRITFKTDGSVVKAGFRLSWKISGTTTCGTNAYTEQGVLLSPNYPLSYINTHDCSTIIEVTPGKYLNITIDDMNIEEHSNCGYDYLLIQEGSGHVIGKYCGKRYPIKLISNTNAVRVRFITDGSVVRAGFRLSWKSESKIIGQWSSWSEYTNTCFGWKNDSGMRARKRSCSLHEPKLHDRYCENSAIQIIECPSTTTTTTSIRNQPKPTCDIPTYINATNLQDADTLVRRIIAYTDAQVMTMRNSTRMLHHDIMARQSDIIKIMAIRTAYQRSKEVLTITRRYIEKIISFRPISSSEVSRINADINKFVTFTNYDTALLTKAARETRLDALEKTRVSNVIGQLQGLSRNLALYTDDVDFDLDPELAEEEVVTINEQVKTAVVLLSKLLC